MQYLDGLAAASPAIMLYVAQHGSDLPGYIFSTLAAYTPSPVDRVINTCEALYAAADVLEADGWTLCAQLARIAQDNGFHDLGQTPRGAGVIAAMRRRLGETSAPDPSEDPAPLAQYLPAVAE